MAALSIILCDQAGSLYSEMQSMQSLRNDVFDLLLSKEACGVGRWPFKITIYRQTEPRS